MCVNGGVSGVGVMPGMSLYKEPPFQVRPGGVLLEKICFILFSSNKVDRLEIYLSVASDWASYFLYKH